MFDPVSCKFFTTEWENVDSRFKLQTFGLNCYHLSYLYDTLSNTVYSDDLLAVTSHLPF